MDDTKPTEIALPPEPGRKDSTGNLAKWTRRAFITTGVLAGGTLAVGVTVGIAIRPGHRAPKIAHLVTDEKEVLVNTWVKIAPNNRITAIVAHSEMGQGAQTALVQMLADEMDARFEDVSFMEAPAVDEYANWALGKGYLMGDADLPSILVPTVDGALMQLAKVMRLQITGGSLSVRATGNTGVRVAGAAAREMLIRAAADAWSAEPSDLTARDSRIIHKRTGQAAPFAEFAAAAARFKPSATPRLKQPSEFRVMGKSVSRLDLPAKIDGSVRFGIDAVVPGMKYAAVRAAPVFGAKLKAAADGSIRSMPGVQDIIQLDDAVAVVADSWWQANQALASMDITWTPTKNDAVSGRQLFEQFEQDLGAAAKSGRSEADIQEGSLKRAFGEADKVVEATYRVPWLAHACMEPMNATARVSDGSCEVWVGTQDPLGARYAVADALEMDVSQVSLHQHVMGGGFGRRSNHDVLIQAAKISRDAGVPVKLIWSREEDIRHDHYRPAVTSRFRAALAQNGDLTGWDNIYHEKHDPPEAPLIPYRVAARKIHHIKSPTHVPFGPWRSVDHSQHGYFTEAFLDEVAEAAGKDPYQFRRELLSGQERHLAVLDLAAKKAGWGEKLPQGRGRGIALHESFWTLVAEVVDVSMVDGRVQVDRVVCAADPGFAVSPDGFAAQMESGIIYGLTAALYGEINIEQGRVLESNFHDYRMLRMNDAPRIETYIINSNNRMGGGGEPGTTAVAPALANAVYAATGTRVRQLPLAGYDFSYRTPEVG